MTFSNKMTIVRGIASVALIPMLMPDEQAIRVFGLLIFTLAAFTDYYDGRLARVNRERTTFGVIADPIADKFLTAVGLIAVSMIDPAFIPPWMTVTIIVREIVVTTYRFVALARGKAIASDRWGKWKTGFQMTVIPYCLVFIAIFSGEEGRYWKAIIRPTVVGDVIYGLGFLIASVTTALTLFSGIMFFLQELKRKS